MDQFRDFFRFLEEFDYKVRKSRVLEVTIVSVSVVNVYDYTVFA